MSFRIFSWIWNRRFISLNPMQWASSLKIPNHQGRLSSRIQTSTSAFPHRVGTCWQILFYLRSLLPNIDSNGDEWRAVNDGRTSKVGCLELRDNQKEVLAHFRLLRHPSMTRHTLFWCHVANSVQNIELIEVSLCHWHSSKDQYFPCLHGSKCRRKMMDLTLIEWHQTQSLKSINDCQKLVGSFNIKIHLVDLLVDISRPDPVQLP